MKWEATPAMRFLNDLLNIHDGYDGEGWLKECKKSMVDTFPRVDPFSILVPAGFDIDKVCCKYAYCRLMIELFSDFLFSIGFECLAFRFSPC